MIIRTRAVDFDVSDATYVGYNWDLYFIYFADVKLPRTVNRASLVRRRLINFAYFNAFAPAVVKGES